MSNFKISSKDFSNKFKKFKLTCNECNSTNITLELETEWGGEDWSGIQIICEDCKSDEEILS
jgi:hypothetical protein